MNIFVLDLNPKIAAEMHCNSHVIKMILESAQILSTVHHKQNTNIVGMYRPTHRNHPCTLWAERSKENYEWLWELCYFLCQEYTLRYKKVHKTQNMLELLKEAPKTIPSLGITKFAQAMPVKYKNEDPVKAYRDYYIYEKTKLLKYKNREKPEWIKI